MYKLKNALKRGTALLGAVGFVAGIGTSVLPAVASADALNPLTERSLTLSSSSPGWSYLDGSGNPTYAYPNSGANGQKTGNTFSFRVSSAATVKAVTFQYCTSPAGNCIAPGDNEVVSGGTDTLDFSSGDATVTGTGTTFVSDGIQPGYKITTAGGNMYTVLSVTNETELEITVNAPDDNDDDGTFYYRGLDSAGTSDLNVVFPSMTLIDNADGPPSTWDKIASGADTVPGHTPKADGTEGTFVVLTGDAAFPVTGTDTNGIDLSSGSATVTGSGTSFTTDLRPGAEITTDLGHTYTVLHIASDTSLTLTTNAVATETGSNFDFTNPGPASTYTTATNWAVGASNAEVTALGDEELKTGRDNFITMTSATGIAMDVQDYMKVVFYGTTANYITNPGSGAFFVRINTYSDNSLIDDAHRIDGGVTVANVMNESITIQTKVLETMEFSVGTHDPTLYTDGVLTGVGESAQEQCGTLLMKDPDLGGSYGTAPHNVLQLGDPNAEYSLRTDTAYDVQSYWRLSSNSSGGATVYYTGHTLTNTVGDEIAPLDDTGASGTASNTGTEQFGLAISHDTSSLPIGPGGSSVESYPVALTGSETYGDSDAGSGDGDFATYLADNTSKGDAFAHLPRLYPLVPMSPYDGGNGTITSGGTAKFAFNDNADTYAVPIATESDQVVNCVTAKMRYIANIAATTPAGIYTTKVNYVASPQY